MAVTSLDQRFILNNFDSLVIDTYNKYKALIDLLNILESDRRKTLLSEKFVVKNLLGYHGLNFFNMVTRDRMEKLIIKDENIQNTLVKYIKRRFAEWKKFSSSDRGRYYIRIPSNELMVLFATVLDFETIISMMETMPRVQNFVRNDENLIQILAKRFDVELFEYTWENLLNAYSYKHLNIRCLNSSMGANLGLLKASKAKDDKLFVRLLDALPPDSETFDCALLEIVKSSDIRGLYTILHRMKELNLKAGYSYHDEIKTATHEFNRYDSKLEYMKIDRTKDYENEEFFYYMERRDSYHKIMTTSAKILFYNDLMSRFESDDSAKNPEIFQAIQRLLE